MDMNIIFIILGISVVGMIALLVYYQMLKKKYASNNELFVKDKIKIKNKSSVNDTSDRIYQAIYNVLVMMPIINYYLKKTRLKLEMSNDYTEYEIRRRTAKLLTFAFLFAITTIFIMVNIVNDLYMSLIIMIFVLIVTEKSIDISITNVSTKILKQMPDAFTSIRHAFHEHGMMEESFDEAIDELGEKDIVPQLRRIKEAMLAESPETELERYYDTAPNRFLKLFAGVSYLTLELGDRKVDGVSVYLKNLNNILSDVYLEILKKEKMDYMFRSLNIIAVVPIFFIQILQGWAETNFPALINFYSSSIGFIVQSSILISIFIAYIFLRILREDSEAIKFDRAISTKWQDRAYKNPIVKMLVDAFKPSKAKSKYRKVEKLIKNSNAYLTIEWLYINKLAYALVAGLLTFALILNMQFIDINSIYNQIGEEFLSFGALTPQQEAAAKSLNKYDEKYVDKYKNQNITKEEFSNKMMDETNGKADAADVDRIYEKIIGVENAYFKYWQLIIVIFVAWIGYMIPTIVLFIRNLLREMEKENEIMQFQSIILMLMYIERVDVQTILEWLSRFSYAFKEPIATALNNYESGAIEALEELKEAVPYKDFIRIVEQLESAVERIPIRSAFDELETERSYYYEKRKTSNEQLINKKVMYGKVFGFTPLIILVGGYLVIPLIAVSMLQMMQYFSTMTF